MINRAISGPVSAGLISLKFSLNILIEGARSDPGNLPFYHNYARKSNFLDMRRINIIGTTGSGKSTFAERLADKLGYTCIHMDHLYWKPGWIESSDEEFISKVEAAISSDTWVLDGNYGRTEHIKWKKADTVIWLDYSYPRTLFQLIKRTVIRAVTKEELWPGTGNRESFRMAFMSKDSIFIWFFRSYRRNKLRYEYLEHSFRKSQINFIRLKSPKDVTAFIENVGI